MAKSVKVETKIKRTFVWMVYVESNVDGEIWFDSIPCASLKKAREVLKKEKNFILKKSKHYSGYTAEELKEEFEIEETKNKFYINDPNDDYYEDLKIVRKGIIY